MTTITEIEPKALELPENDRLVLAARLLLSVEPLSDESVDEAWSQEIQKRILEIDQGRVEGIPLDLALTRLRQATHRAT